MRPFNSDKPRNEHPQWDPGTRNDHEHETPTRSAPPRRKLPTRNQPQPPPLPPGIDLSGPALPPQFPHPYLYRPPPAFFQPPRMPPQVSRMHPSHMSNPFAHLNPQHSIPQSSYQAQASHMPGSFNSQHGFGSGSLNGGISPFPSSSYGANAFTPGASSSVFNGGALGGQGQGLASVAAQQGFARGAAMQEHSAHQLEAATMDPKSGAAGRIRQVWRHNLETEMAVLRQLIQKYPYVSMVCSSQAL